MICRGTTPTIKFVFKTINTSDIVVAYLTVEQKDVKLFEKTLADATVGKGYLEWTLTQEETLLFDEKSNLKLQCRYKTAGGSAYGTKIYEVPPYAILKEGVI